MLKSSHSFRGFGLRIMEGSLNSPVSSTVRYDESYLLRLGCGQLVYNLTTSWWNTTNSPFPEQKRQRYRHTDILALHDWNPTPVNRYTVYIQPYWMISFQCCRISTIIEATTRVWLCCRMERNPSERHQRGTDKVAVSRLQRPKFRGLSKRKNLASKAWQVVKDWVHKP